MAELFGVKIPTISYHLKEVYDSGELSREATLRKFRTVQQEGRREVRREIEFYNLDAIISVGYRVNSTQATRFRIWATQTLREFVIKGFVLDDERLKLNKRFGKDYFDELLERIREIRASERRFYLKITDIYEQCSIDYDKKAEITKLFIKPAGLFGCTLGCTNGCTVPSDEPRKNRQETKKPRFLPGFLEGWLRGLEPPTLRATI